MRGEEKLQALAWMSIPVVSYDSDFEGLGRSEFIKMFLLLDLNSKCMLMLKTEAFDYDFFSSMLMNESIYGSLTMSSQIFIGLNSAIHSLIFTCIFLNACNMAINLKNEQSKKRDFISGQASTDGHKDLASPRKRTANVDLHSEYLHFQRYKEFLQEVVERQEKQTFEKVIQACKTARNYFKEHKVLTYKALLQLASQAALSRSRTEFYSQLSLNSPEINTLRNTSPDYKGNSNPEKRGIKHLYENNESEIEMLEQFDLLISSDSNTRSKIELCDFLKADLPEEKQKNRQSMMKKITSTVTKAFRRAKSPLKFISTLTKKEGNSLLEPPVKKERSVETNRQNLLSFSPDKQAEEEIQESNRLLITNGKDAEEERKLPEPLHAEAEENISINDDVEGIGYKDNHRNQLGSLHNNKFLGHY